MKKLKVRGFIEISPNIKGKGSTVKATYLARDAVKQNNIFSIWGNIDLGQITMELMSELSKTSLLENGMLDKQIYVSCDELPNLKSLNLLKQPAHKTYILSDDETYELLRSRGLDLPKMRFEESSIMVPDNYFDRGIIAKYHPQSELFGSTAKEILVEMVRVVKPGGRIILTSFDEFPITNNLILDSVMNDLFLNSYFTASSEESIRTDFLDAGIENVEFMNYKGYIVTVAIV